MPADGYDWLNWLVYNEPNEDFGAKLRSWELEGLTAERIRARILEHHNIPDISINTVRRWLYRARREAQANGLKEKSA